MFTVVTLTISPAWSLLKTHWRISGTHWNAATPPPTPGRELSNTLFSLIEQLFSWSSQLDFADAPTGPRCVVCHGAVAGREATAFDINTAAIPGCRTGPRHSVIWFGGTAYDDPGVRPRQGRAIAGNETILDASVWNSTHSKYRPRCRRSRWLPTNSGARSGWRIRNRCLRHDRPWLFPPCRTDRRARQ